MGEITIPADQPDASFGSLGSRYYGIFRLPHGRWKQLLGKDKERLYFTSAQEATRAAMAHVNGILFRTIRADAEPDEKTVAKVLDVTGWKADKAHREVESRIIRRGDGKRAVIVERRKGA